MGERSRRRIRDLVTRLAFEGLSENEIGCARISMMARSIRSTKGPDTEEQDQSLPLSRFSLQRTAGPYNRVNFGPCDPHRRMAVDHPIPEVSLQRQRLLSRATYGLMHCSN